MDMLSLLNGLSDPESYPHPVRTVHTKQTHISIVFLTEELVYKVRKPVKFPFLDFSSLSLRLADCEREVQLNQRLAADVYLGVVPIALRDGRLQVGGAGEVVEWAVKMRRLPDEATLESRLARGEVGPEMMGMLGRRLAAFHAGAVAGPEISEFARYEAVAQNLLDNLADGSPHDASVVDPAMFNRVRELTRVRLAESRELIEQRAARGIPRDTHGDLRLDHVYLFPDRKPPEDLCVIDCIEFNDGFRHADPVADIAFLIMDLKFHGRRDLAANLADQYFTASGDEEGRQLLPLYVSYRAAVRAKVETLKLAETEIPETERRDAAERARAHWLLALSELEIPSRRPCLILVGGLQGTGKSTLAHDMAESADFSLIRTDVIRKELAGKSETTSMRSAMQSGIYTAEWTERTYAECLRRAVELLTAGQRVIVDGTFSSERHRRQFLNAATRLGLPGLLLICEADPQVVQNRLEVRTGDASDADWSVHLAAAANWEPYGEQTARVTSRINTGQTAEFARLDAEMVLRSAELVEQIPCEIH